MNALGQFGSGEQVSIKLLPTQPPIGVPIPAPNSDITGLMILIEILCLPADINGGHDYTQPGYKGSSCTPVTITLVLKKGKAGWYLANNNTDNLQTVKCFINTTEIVVGDLDFRLDSVPPSGP